MGKRKGKGQRRNPDVPPSPGPPPKPRKKLSKKAIIAIALATAGIGALAYFLWRSQQPGGITGGGGGGNGGTGGDGGGTDGGRTKEMFVLRIKALYPEGDALPYAGITIDGPSKQSSVADQLGLDSFNVPFGVYTVTVYAKQTTYDGYFRYDGQATVDTGAIISGTTVSVYTQGTFVPRAGRPIPQ